VIDVFSHFSLPQISTVARRTSLAALCIGGIAVVGLGLSGHALVGMGICVGLGLALGNFRLISRATVKASTSGNADTRRPLALNTLGRMGAITVIAFGLVFLSRPLGFGTLIGLATFQFTLLANVVVAMLHEQEQPTIAPGATGELES
jgi:ATP synthase I chain